MRYSILGYNQELVIEFNNNHEDAKLDITDLIILDYIANSHGNPTFSHKCTNDIIYTHINRAQLLEDLPILSIKENMLSKRLGKLVELELLDVKCIANETLRGSKSYYRLTDSAYALKQSNIQLSKQDDENCDNNEHTTGCKKLHTVTRPGVKNYTSVSTNISNTNKTKDIIEDNIDNIKIKSNKGSSGKGLFQSSKEQQAIQIAKIYNEVCTNLSKVKVLNDEKLSLIDELLQTYSMDDFREACEIANATPFLLGDNDRGWKANFNFIIREKKLTKILEGDYGSTQKPRKKSKISELPCNKTVRTRTATEEEKRETAKMLQEMKERGEQIEF